MIVLALAVPGFAWPPLPADLAAAAHAYDDAQVNGYRAALERLVADDYVLVNGAGQVQDKARLIADYVAPASSWTRSRSKSRSRRCWATPPCWAAGST